MAQRVGVGSAGTRALSGAFGAISDLAGQSLDRENKQRVAEASSAREVFRSLLKDYSDKVAAGSMEPEQAENALKLQGFNVPPGYFQTVQPSVESGLNKIVGEIGKAKGYNEVPGPLAIDAQLPKRLQPSIDAFGPNPKTQGPSEPGDLPSTPTGNLATPEFQRLLNIAKEKQSSFAPERVDVYDPASASMQTTFPSANPNELTGRTFQKTPTPEQAGANEGASVLAGLKAKLAGGAGTLEGGVESQKLDASRTATAKTAGATTRATTQAGIDVSTAPGNVQKEATRTGALAYATKRMQDKAAIDGVDPNLAKTFIKGTTTNRPYAYIPPGIDPATHKVALGQFAKAGIPVIYDKGAADALDEIQQARANLDTILDMFEGKLPKGPDGRVISAPANTLKKYMQTDPMLAASVSNFAAAVQNFRALAGSRNLRITKGEIDRSTQAQPNETDTWQTALDKAFIQNQFLTNAENGVLGRPKTAGR
jgi:hypothetical protein